MKLEFDMNGLLNEIDNSETKSEIKSFGQAVFDEGYDDFDERIIERGEDYYEKGKVKSLISDSANSTFYATVLGSYDKEYNVEISYELHGGSICLDYSCTCPCDFPCKHTYAALLAIKEDEYTLINLKKQINKKELSLEELITRIPADRLKEYILSKEGINQVLFNIEHLEKEFREYLPNQTYEYYYNNLYNRYVLNGEDERMIDEYFDIIADYFSSHTYDEAFKIMKSIIEVYYELNMMYSKYFIVEIFPKISLFIRVIYNNCDEQVKVIIDEWKRYITEKNCYDSIFLKDIMDSIDKR